MNERANLMFKGKKVTVGVTGGIAAYKAADIVSWLKKNGADVRVVMTESACHIITPLTLKTLSGKSVALNTMDDGAEWNVPHLDCAACDLFLIVPATANILAKAANGVADDILSSALLATRAKVLFAPAMHTDMYNNPATQENISRLQQRGWQMIPPAKGILACGKEGVGRLAGVDTIMNIVEHVLLGACLLSGKKVLVTAGPTYEYIDPVRYIGNRSSGKMGYALAVAAATAGAEVCLVSGPSSLAKPPKIRCIDVVSASDMYKACHDEYADTDIVIMAAAVADFRPAQYAEQKIKKGKEEILSLVANPDILASLGKDKGKRILVGFAAETEDLANYATRKLRQKNLDMIVANNVSVDGAGFDVDTNIITTITPDGDTDVIQEWPLMTKLQAADQIISLIAALPRFHEK